MVQTVTGGIPAGELGHCQPHEHLFVTDTPAARQNPALRIDDLERSVAEARDYRRAGGRTIVDCQPVGAGRDIRALRRISLDADIRIIASTGYHLPGFYPEEHWIFTGDADRLCDRFLDELTRGVPPEALGDTAVRPGVVKAAIGREGPVGRFGVCLRAAARAAARGGVPLILHTEAGAGAVEAVALCESEGLDPARIAVCHADRQAADFSVHEAIAATGAFLEYDTVARYKYHDDGAELNLIRHMLSRGCEKRLLLSLDTTAARLARYGGQPGLAFILESFIPMLSEAGVSAREIESITRDNPRLLFSE